MPKSRTVLLWGENDLLTKAMEMFLSAGEADSWEIIKLPADQRISSFVEQVQEIKPNLVILYQAKSCDAASALSRLLQEEPDLRLIAFSLENNVVQLYSKRSITVRHVSDLLSVIEDRNFFENSV